jgi:Fur family ferric uptake transcriptional regulator
VNASPQDLRQPFGSGRMTAQRAAIVRAAATMECAFTVDDLVGSARIGDPTLGVATVYRAVSALEKSGWLERVGERSGSALYARCSAGDHHHHHLICTGCGRLEPADCPVESIVLGAEKASGFVVTGHEVTLWGLCPDCVEDGEN